MGTASLKGGEHVPPSPSLSAVEPEKLVRDVHPAELLLPDGSLETGLRVFITTGRLIVFRASADGQIEPPLELAVSEPVSVPADRGTLRGALEVKLADGGTVWVNRGRGCGCGSPLKALAPPVSWTGNTKQGAGR